MWTLKSDMMYWLYTIVAEPMIIHTFSVWWLKMKQATVVNKLSSANTCLSTPTAALETLVNLPPEKINEKGQYSPISAGKFS